MKGGDFHDKPYDGGTLTKLNIFELYVQAWIPVFLSRPEAPFQELHIFDFFAGPGQDTHKVPGSPVRILQQLQRSLNQGLVSWGKVRKIVHFFDFNKEKINHLRTKITKERLSVDDVELDIRDIDFESALKEYDHVLSNSRTAKMLIIDQCGVDAVSDDIFKKLICYPRTDFIFFLSSNTLHRFREHPAIKQKIPMPDDSYHIHRAAFQYYKNLIPSDMEVYLGPFSIKKDTGNIYGLIFGSRHPLGIHKFLEVAWKNDQIAGEANFDVDRENIKEDELLLDLGVMVPKKISVFEEALKEAFKQKLFSHEMDVAKFCIESGVTCKHAENVIKDLKKEGVFQCNFRVPNVRNHKNPRPIKYI